MKKSGLIFVLLAILGNFQYHLWSGRGSLPEVIKMQTQLAQLQTEIDAAEKTNAQLQAEVSDLKDGMDMVEERARFELGMVKPNEVLVQYLQ